MGIAVGANVKIANIDGWTSLQRAVSNGHAPAIETLIKAGNANVVLSLLLPYVSILMLFMHEGLPQTAADLVSVLLLLDFARFLWVIVHVLGKLDPQA